ncbi:hypothetical protein [Consotaella aegiceratis]|uniref:hypothetical protein n=1 Tax=Consotaella aegiceratis TaxID=3097961 RepID=UPI002F419E41
MSDPFVNPLARGGANAVNSVRAIKRWTRDRLGLAEDVVVSVNELACHLPGCPPKETVILVMRSRDQTLQVSIHKPVLDVVQADVDHALFAAARFDGELRLPWRD